MAAEASNTLAWKPIFSLARPVRAIVTAGYSRVLHPSLLQVDERASASQGCPQP